MNLTPKYIASNVRFTFCLPFGCCERGVCIMHWIYVYFRSFFPPRYFIYARCGSFSFHPEAEQIETEPYVPIWIADVCCLLCHFSHTHAQHTTKEENKKNEKIKFPACVCFALSHDLMIGTMQFTWWNDSTQELNACRMPHVNWWVCACVW